MQPYIKSYSLSELGIIKKNINEILSGVNEDYEREHDITSENRLICSFDDMIGKNLNGITYAV